MKVFKTLQKQACKYAKPCKVRFRQPFFTRGKKKKLSILSKEGLITLLEEKDR